MILGSYERSGWGDLFPYELGNYFEPQNLANHRVVNIPHINGLPPNLYSSIHTQLGENLLEPWAKKNTKATVWIGRCNGGRRRGCKTPTKVAGNQQKHQMMLRIVWVRDFFSQKTGPWCALVIGPKWLVRAGLFKALSTLGTYHRLLRSCRWVRKGRWNKYGVFWDDWGRFVFFRHPGC